jgi:thiol-disulfide isomerase/thioredoxin
MRFKIAFVSLAALSLALAGCDKQSGQTTQGAGNAAVTSGEASPDEVTSDEAPPSNEADGGGETFKHVVDRSHKGEGMPDKNFTGPDGKPTTLSALAGGKPLLVNLWATWCAPCVAELPALDKLAAASAGKGVTVIAVSQDQGLPAHVDAFLAQRKFTTLKRNLDPDNNLGFHYNTGTLPTTVLYDGKGKEVARVVGALDWAGEDGRKLMAEIGG